MYNTNSLESLSDCLVSLYSETKYQYVYLSIGSKKNEERVSFNYPNTNLSLTTNAEYQMIPMFLRERETIDKVLIIIIDDFHNEGLKIHNTNLLLDIQSNHQNIEIVLVDHILTLNTIGLYLKRIADTNTRHKLDASRFMVTNFICFKRPNQKQLNFENDLPVTIQRCLNVLHEGYYDNCFYQWYNYAYYTYNYIYCYNKFNLQRLITIRRLFALINTVIENSILTEDNCNNITSYTKTLHISEQKKWDCFLNNSINIMELQ
jgi:hypothetical protein